MKRSVRWTILLLSLVIEGLLFWYVDPGNRFSGFTFGVMGAAAISFFLVTSELCFLYRNQRRAKRDLVPGEEIKYSTGRHWLVLLQSIRASRSSRWGVWLPVRLALIATIYYLGLVLWKISLIPSALPTWLVNPIHTMLVGHTFVMIKYLAIAWAGVWVFRHLLVWVHELKKSVEKHGIWFWLWRIAHLCHYVLRAIPIAIFLVALFGGALDWCGRLGHLYTTLPHNGYVAALYLPLLITNFFLVVHIPEWRSLRYFLAVDSESKSARLIETNGVFDDEPDVINLTRIIEIGIERMSPWQRILHIGTVVLHEQSGGVEGRKLDHIWDPHRLKHEIDICINRRLAHSAGGD